MPERRGAAVYVRISQSDDPAKQGVGRQAEDCRALCARLHWPVHEVYEDDDRSAYSRRKPRPAYQRMMADLRAGVCDAVVVWHLDRLYRQPRELEDLLDLCEHGKVGFAACSGDYDLATADGRFMARMMVNVANKASADASRRQKRKGDQVAEEGRSHGGLLPYGFSKEDRNTLDEHEAECIREVTRNLINGASLRSQVRMLNDRGDYHGHPWQERAFARMLLRPRLIGKREHNGAIYDAIWPAILTEEDQFVLRALLTDPARRHPEIQPRYLLSGMLRCGVCGQKMSHAPGWNKNPPHYVCPPAPRGCGKVSVTQAPLEQHVSDAVLDWLDAGTALHDVEVVEGPELDELAPLRERLAMFERLMVEGTMSAEAYGRMAPQVEAQMAAVEERNANRIREKTPDLTSNLPGGPEEAREWWPQFSTEERHDVIEAVVESIDIMPVSKTHRFDPARVRVHWR